MREAKYKNLVLYKILLLIVNQDISTFLESNLRLIRQERCLEASWPGEHVVGHLV